MWNHSSETFNNGRYWDNTYGQMLISDRRIKQEVNWLKTWITQRLEWMDANIGLITGVESGVGNPIGSVVMPNPFSEELNLSI